MSKADSEQRNQGQGIISFAHTTQGRPALIHPKLLTAYPHHKLPPTHPPPPPPPPTDTHILSSPPQLHSPDTTTTVTHPSPHLNSKHKSKQCFPDSPQAADSCPHHRHCHTYSPSPHLHNKRPNSTGLSPGSEAYQRLVKEAAALAPLVEGYQELKRKQQDVSLGGGEGRLV